jgi:hypothetical protein
MACDLELNSSFNALLYFVIMQCDPEDYAAQHDKQHPSLELLPQWHIRQLCQLYGSLGSAAAKEYTECSVSGKTSPFNLTNN